jgi:hypothetical protein
MTEQMTEPTTGGGVVVEDDPEAQARMRELDERIEAQGGVGTEDDVGTRGGFGSATTMVDKARAELGYRETGENDTKYNRWLGAIAGYPEGGFGYPWCHAFQSWCLGNSDNADAGPKTASCAAGVKWFSDRGRFGQTPHVGDLVYYGPGGGQHVELVIGVSPTQIVTIGGNTSGAGADGKALFNGDGVYQKSVNRTSKIFGYGSPQYSIDAVPPSDPGKGAAGPKAVKPMTNVRSIKQQQIGVNSLGYTPPLDTDGEWGPKTEAGVKWLQTRIGVTSDGQWGPGTEKAFKAFKG